MRLLLAGLLISTISLVSLHAQEIEKIGISGLEEILAANEDQLHVVNFWATWCPPCVTELPYFEKLSQEFRGKGVKFILISLDFPSQIDSKLIPFLKKNKVTADVRVMTNLDYNSWIDKVDGNWQGNIPVTLFFNNARSIRYFHPSELTEKELRDMITKYKQL
jgi:thiol-disulfide isomerase/thioredoxin